MSGSRALGFTLTEVEVTRDGTRILGKTNARIPAGRCTAITGPSGAGKSTLLRLLNRLDEPTHGRVLLNGVWLPELDVLALRRRVTLLTQQLTALTDRVGDELRVGQPNLAEPALVELLTRVGLPAAFAHRRMAELSGGETQRVCLARALAVRPEVLLLDEPTSALDHHNTTVISQLIRRHQADGGATVLVSHDQILVRSLANEVLALDQGHLLTADDLDQIKSQEATT